MHPPFSSRFLRAAGVLLTFDLVAAVLLLGAARLGGSLDPVDGAPSMAAVALDVAFFVVLGAAILGAPIVAALAARSTVPEPARASSVRPIALGLLAVPVALLAVPTVFLGHLAIEPAVFSVIYVAIELARVAAHASLAALGAVRASSEVPTPASGVRG